MWPFTMRNLIEPKERYIWVKIRILHETDKAILIYNEKILDPQVADIWGEVKE